MATSRRFVRSCRRRRRLASCVCRGAIVVYDLMLDGDVERRAACRWPRRRQIVFSLKVALTRRRRSSRVARRHARLIDAVAAVLVGCRRLVL